MTIALTISSALLVLFGLGFGAWKGIRSILLALAATVLGFIVSGYWGDAWATQLSEQYSVDARALSLALSAVLLLGPALIIGYGGSNLLPKTGLLKPIQRLGGALLGILNGIVQAGFLLRYASNLYPDVLKELKALPAMGWLHEGPPLIALVIASGGLLAVLVQALLQSLKSRPARVAPTIATSPASPTSATSAAQPNATVRLSSSTPAATAAPSAEQRQANQASVLDKVNKALDQK